MIYVIDDPHARLKPSFWDVNDYKVGRSQPSFDKQYVRDWLTQSGWNKGRPRPSFRRHRAGTSELQGSIPPADGTEIA